MNNRHHLDKVADRLVAGGRLAGRIVVVGHSVGAAAGSWMIPRLVASGVEVRGLVCVDGNDSRNHLIEQAWPQLELIPIRAVMAPPNPCNRQGQLIYFLERERPGSVRVIDGAGHGDIEMLGTGAGRLVCKDTSGVAEWRAVQSAVLESVGQLIL